MVLIAIPPKRYQQSATLTRRRRKLLRPDVRTDRNKRKNTKRGRQP
jgi:hypothetical protein